MRKTKPLINRELNDRPTFKTLTGTLRELIENVSTEEEPYLKLKLLNQVDEYLKNKQLDDTRSTNKKEI